MVATAVLSPVVVDADGIAWIGGTRFKVLHIAIDHRMGRTPQAIQEAHPHLALFQIYAALSYYYAHQDDFDTEIRRAEDLYRAGWEAQQADSAHQSHVKALQERYQALQDESA
ncbi:MAG: DUF433 domain-containing protein [Armatimonadetes bacterium]|nr:DUF433 domain-containing protein [Armatimonadota bacterium]